MLGLVPGIHLLVAKNGRRTWVAGIRASEATPFFERLRRAMTKKDGKGIDE
jgi:hypothetical protein